MEQNEKNRQKAQELTKEELDQVNGGGFLPRPKGYDDPLTCQLLLTSQELLGDKPERYFLGKLWLGSMPSQSLLSAGGISHRVFSWRRKGTTWVRGRFSDL